jgi:PTH2 family peptidyl-tRNA hydrolase
MVDIMENISKELRIYLIVNDSLNMSPGKIAAQCGHAVQELIDKTISNNFLLGFKYIDCSKIFTKIVLKASKEEWNQLLESKILYSHSIIIDDGRTEVLPNSQTVIGIGPITKNNAKQLVGHLKLL